MPIWSAHAAGRSSSRWPGIIPGDLSGRLQQMTRCRNLLVHVYWRIDYGQVYDILQRSLDDLREFASIVAALT